MLDGSGKIPPYKFTRFRPDEAEAAPSFEAIAGSAARMSPVNGTPIDWPSLGRHTAWFDREDAGKIIERNFASGNLSDSERSILAEWVTNGCLVVKGAIPERDIDEVNAFVENLLTTSDPVRGVEFLGFTLDPKKGGSTVSHKEMVALSPEQRQAHARLSPWRIHELWARCDAAKRIYRNDRVNDVVSLIFGRAAYPRSTINFYLGSQQDLHQDMAVFHVFPGNYLVGAWVALEDITPDSGPLRYAPGTHRSSHFPPFDNFPQTQLRTCSSDLHDEYHRFTNDLAQAHGVKPFLGKKGDVFLWHGMLIHGGSSVENPQATRRSMVIHYLTKGVDQTEKIVGPFNWK